MIMFYFALIEEEEDRISFEQIYHDYHLQMLYVAKRYLNSHEDAEDAVQESLIRIARKIKLIPTGSADKRKAYIMTIVKNVALRMKEKGDREANCYELTKQQISFSEDPFEELCKKEDFDKLLSAFHQIPLHYREVLMLRYVFDIPPREIAAVLERKETTVRQYLARGKKMVTDCYMEEVC